MIWVLKLSGAVLVSVAGFLFGAEQAAGLHRQALFWAELARMLVQIQDAVHYRALATPCLLEELRAGGYPCLLYTSRWDAPAENIDPSPLPARSQNIARNWAMGRFSITATKSVYIDERASVKE